MSFAVRGYNSLDQARSLLRDLKMARFILSERLLNISHFLQGQYTKLPPRATFIVQALGAAIANPVNLCCAPCLITSAQVNF